MKRSLLALGFVSLSLASGVAQGTKALLLARPLGNDPVRVVSAREGTSELKSSGRQFPNSHAWEATFNAGDDWLKDLSFTIKNVSDRTITYVEISCALFESSDWQKELAAHSTPANPIVGQASNVLGWRPEHALYSPRLGSAKAPDADQRPAFELAPGQKFTLPLQDPQTYSQLKSTVEAKQPLSTINGCDASISAIFFADGTKWSSHTYWRPAVQPGRYEVIPANEIPHINAEETLK